MRNLNLFNVWLKVTILVCLTLSFSNALYSQCNAVCQDTTINLNSDCCAVISASDLVSSSVACEIASTNISRTSLSFDQNIIAIYGGGNANDSWTTNNSGDVELGLRAKVRFPVPDNTFNSNGDGTYSHDAGAGSFGFSCAGCAALWNFEWSINTTSGGLNLDDYTYALGIDFDSTDNKSYLTFDLINGQPFFDHSIGDNSTLNGGGTEAADAAAYASLIANNTIAQNSWNMDFFDDAPFDIFDPNSNGRYEVYLAAYDANGNEIARTNISVIVGTGTGTPGSYLTFDLNDTGIQPVTLTITDTVGNISSCTANVTVVDDPPVAVCQDITINLDNNCCGTASASEINNNSVDNCGIQSMTLTHSGLSPDENIVAIFGSGNADTDWTINNSGPVELGLRAKVRFPVPQNVFNSNGDGSYSHLAGPRNLANPLTPLWSFEWSINTDPTGTTGAVLDDFTYAIGIDFDKSDTKLYRIFDLIHGDNPNGDDYYDHSIGTNSTLNGGGSEASDAGLYNALTAIYNVAQNSWRMDFFSQPPFNNIFDPADDGRYEFFLAAYDAFGNEVAKTHMSVIVGAGTGTPGSYLTFDINDIGANPVTLTVTDDNGNTNSCSANVTVMDSINPVIACPEDIFIEACSVDTTTVNETNAGFALSTTLVTLSPAQIAAFIAIDSQSDITEACGYTVTYQDVVSAGTCPWTITRTYTITDDANNTSSCDQTITVDDVTLPSAVTQDPGPLNVDAGCAILVTASEISNNSTDNCDFELGISKTGMPGAGGTYASPVGSLSFSQPTDFDLISLTPDNTLTAYLHVIDACGNETISAAQDVTVNDNTAPTALCQDTTLSLTNNCCATVSASEINNSSSDNCAIESMTLSRASQDFDENIVAIFGSGNADDSWTINNVGPVELGLRAKVRFPVPQNVFNSNGDGSYSHLAGPRSLANPLTPLWSFEWSINTDPTGTTGAVLDDFSYAIGIDFDKSDSKLYRVFDLIHGDNPNGDDFFDHSVGTNSTLNGGGSEAGDAALYDALTAIYNVAQNSWRMDFFSQPPFNNIFDPADDGRYEFFLAAYDAGGNEVARTNMSVIVGAGTGTPGSYLTFDINDIGVQPVTLTVTDFAGNSSTCSANVTVPAIAPPTAICQDITVSLDASGNAEIDVTDIDNGSSSSCGSLNLSIDDSLFTCLDVGANNIVTLTVSDTTGSTVTCTSTVTVLDAPVMVISCPDTITVDAPLGTCEAVVNFDNPIPSYTSCFQGFEDPAWLSNVATDWNDFISTVTRVSSGTNGVSSATGAAHAVIDATADPQTGAYTRLCGYSDDFGLGFSTSLDVYMDLNDPAVLADTYGWDLTTAASNQSGGHLRDFIFHTASDVAGNILVGGSNNTNFTRRNDIATLNHYTITTSGWYTFQWVFRDDAGALAVDLNLVDAAGTVLWTETRSDPADLIATIVGGNRYMWFTFLEVDNIAIDNTQMERIASSAAVTCNPASGSTFSLGSNTVTCTAVNACGTATTCEFIVIVNDITPPAALCQSVTVNLDNNCCASVSASDINNGSSDLCGSISSMSLTRSSLDFDENVIAIFGGGNADDSWTTNNSGDVEIGLRAKVRFPSPSNTFYSNGDGTYSHPAGAGTFGFSCTDCAALWNFEWSINTTAGGLNLDDYTYELGIDLDSTDNKNYLTFDLINGQPFFDHSIGDNGTLNGAGTEATDAASYAGLIANNTIAQNSWNMDFFDDAPFNIFDPNSNGRYEFYIAAYDANGNEVARTNISVIVGSGTGTSGSYLNFGLNDAGVQPVTLTVTDSSGNTSSCTANVTVIDEAPVVLCQDTIINLDNNCCASVSASDLVSSSDNCGIESMIITRSSLDFDENVIAIFGGGNADDSWTTNNSGDVEIGLRAKVRFPSPSNTFYSNGDGTYSHPAGAGTFGFSCTDCAALWNFEWSINTTAGGLNLDDYTYELGIDFDSTDNKSFLIFDLINGQPFFDHSIGTNATANGAGIEATDAASYAGLIANNTIAQNSWNMDFFDDAPFNIFDPNSNGRYDFYLAAYDADGNEVARTNISVIVGTGTGTPGSYLTFNTSDIGTQQVTITVTDNGGNSSTCTANVTVMDTLAPVAVCQDTILNLDNKCCASVSASDLVSSSDACGIETMSITRSSLSFDENVVAIFGGGNADDSWTTNNSGDVELALRAKVRYPVPANIFNSNGDGTYNHLAGQGTPITRALWNFEWSVNTTAGGSNLDDYTYALGIDFDASDNKTYLTFDLINGQPFFDHSIGDNSTLNGAGTEAVDATDYASLIANNTIAQNSWNMDFFDEAPFNIFDPNDNGRYEIYLAAYDANGNEVAKTNISVIVGSGTGTPGSYLTFDASDIGVQSVTITVTDNGGNTSTCSANVTVTDTITPEITCPDDISIEACSVDATTINATNAGFAYSDTSVTLTPEQVLEFIAIDAQSSVTEACDYTVSYQDVVSTGNCPWTVTRTYTITDGGNNTSSCDQIITVDDNTFPTAVTQNPGPLYVDASCSVTVTASEISSNNNNDFSSAITTGPSQAPGVWYTDRYAPAGFEAEFLFDGDERLKHSIAAADGANNRPPSFVSAFYNTQGRKFDLPDPTTYMQIDLYIPADWATSNRRMAGLWGTAVDSANNISAYPIVEFSSDDNTPRFHAWENTGWVDMGLPTGFAYDTWVTLKVKLLANGEFQVEAGDLAYVTSTNGINASERIDNVILQGHNTTTGVSYDIFWDNFTTETSTDNCNFVIGISNTGVAGAGGTYTTPVNSLTLMQPADFDLDNSTPDSTGTVYLHVIDACGNETISPAQDVTVIDTVAPTAVCQDTILNLDNGCCATVSAAELISSSDNCGIASMTLTRSSLDFDENVVAIFGGGNADDSWAINNSGDVELGLRAKVRYPVPSNTFNSNGDGTYSHLAGQGSPITRALWNFEWSINTTAGGLNLDDYTYALGIDFDSTDNKSYLVFDLINGQPFFDHSIGDNSTLNGAGMEAVDSASYASLIANNTIAQNSWNMDFFDEAPFNIFDPNSNGRYEFFLAAYDSLGNEVARTNISVIVGAGTGTPGSYLTFDGSDIGTQPVTLTVTDNSGNTSTCSANVTVIDTIPRICNTDCTLGDTEVWNPLSCSCEIDVVTISGCTDLIACNFNPDANCDDGSCLFPTDSTLTEDICNGDYIIINNEFYITAGTYVDTLTNAVGCDSILTIVINLFFPSYDTLSFDVCTGETVMVNGNDYGVGMFTETFTNSDNCDSLLTIIVNELFPTSNTLSFDVCTGDTETVNGTDYGVGTHTETLVNAAGCDSVLTIVINELFPTANTISFNVCTGDTETVNGTDYGVGTHTETLVNAAGCDSVLTIVINELFPTANTINFDVCTGDTETVNGTDYGVGTYTETLVNAAGCDSVLTIVIHELFPTSNTISFDVCTGETETVNGTDYGVGTYTETLVNTAGCDSVLTIVINELFPTSNSISFDVCTGDTETVNGTDYGVGTFTQTLVNAAGCDSTLTIVINELFPTSNTISFDVCTGDTETVNGTDYGVGTFTQTLVNAAGCDSVLTIVINELFPTSNTISFDVCTGDTETVNGTDYGVGTHTETLVNAAGCDSTLTIVINELFPTSNTISFDVCTGETETVNGNDYGVGTFTETLVNAVGCDSVLTIVINELFPTSNTISFDVCTGETETVNGNDYGVGTFTETLVNAAGCDSVLTIVINELFPTSNTISFDVCTGETETVNGNDYGVGTFTETLVNAAGCDSILTIVINELFPTSNTISFDVCTGETETVNGSDYGVGIFTETLVNAAGCDSILTININAYPVTDNIDITYTGCSGDGYEYISPGGIAYNESNPTGSETLLDSNGCSYEVNVNLVFNPVGCTDPLYCEYDPSAICDDNSCITLTANDSDCDGVPTTTDCDDNDPLVINTNTNDADCDGVPTNTDCDDNDPAIGNDVCSSCTISCPDNISVINDTGLCGAIVDYEVTYLSDCFGTVNVIQTEGIASGQEFPVGYTINTFTITDIAGNTSTCSFGVFVFDTEMPNISCPGDQVIYASSNCDAALPDYTGAILSSDNCSNLVSVSQTPDAGDPISANTVVNVTITAVYDNNETVDCSFKVTTILDNIVLPQAICNDISIDLDDNGIAIITPADIDGGSTGACDLSYGISQNLFDCNDFFETVTLTVEDGNGNQSTCQANVTITDNTAPTCNVQDITLALDQYGNGSITVDDINNASSDACYLQLLYVDPCTFYCNDVGTVVEVTLTMRDFVGNNTSCTANVTVIDPFGGCDGSLCGDSIQNFDELGVDCGGSFCIPCEGCATQRHFDNELIPGGLEEKVDNRITTSGSVITDNNNGLIHLVAKNYIELSSGFEIPSGSEVELKIGTCNE